MITGKELETLEEIRKFERVTAHICMQKDVGINGNLFGGNMLAFLDEACAIFAREKSKQWYMVTLRFGEMVFHKPIKEGDIIVFYCGEQIRGKHSLTFSVMAKVFGELVLSTDCTFVAVDSNGKKEEIEWEK
jgi:acyl-CoA thioesterase YciA